MIYKASKRYSIRKLANCRDILHLKPIHRRLIPARYASAFESRPTKLEIPTERLFEINCLSRSPAARSPLPPSPAFKHYFAAAPRALSASPGVSIPQTRALGGYRSAGPACERLRRKRRNLSQEIILNYRRTGAGGARRRGTGPISGYGARLIIPAYLGRARHPRNKTHRGLARR